MLVDKLTCCSQHSDEYPDIPSGNHDVLLIGGSRRPHPLLSPSRPNAHGQDNKVEHNDGDDPAHIQIASITVIGGSNSVSVIIASIQRVVPVERIDRAGRHDGLQSEGKNFV